jgi:hypothetical protein
MLSITVTFPHAYAYEHNSKQIGNCSSRSKFERELEKSGDLDDDLEAFEVLPYIDCKSSISVVVNGVEFDPNLTFDSFKRNLDTSIDYNPEIPSAKNCVSILKKSQVYYSKTFDWVDVSDFDPKNILIVTGSDQNSQEYFIGIEYSEILSDHEHDADITGGSDCEFEFFYHQDKVWSS